MVYPNPTKQFLYVELKEFEKVQSIALFNLAGVKMLSINNPKTSLQTIDVESFTAGVYLLRVTFIDGSTQTTKVVR